MLYKNTSGIRRVWPQLQRPDGSTLELDAGESAELDLPAGFKDTNLQPPPKPKKQKKAAAEKAPPAGDPADDKEKTA